MTTLADLEPQEIITLFASLSAIPRGSGNEKAVSDWIARFAGEHGLVVHQDDLFNLLIRKPGTNGYQDAPTVMLHGHIDMVCEKEEGHHHNFLTEPLTLVVGAEDITAEGTSLGADNGVGVAYILALLASTDLPHPPLEAVLTVMEEKGKVGGAHFDTSKLTATRMIDFNWITDHQILAGCGGDLTLTIDFERDSTATPVGHIGRRISVRGLRGGHCEFDIHLERANAIIAMGRILARITEHAPFRLVEVAGGAQNNAIPAEASALIMIDPADTALVDNIVITTGTALVDEFASADPSLRVEFDTAPRTETSQSPSPSQAIAQFISLIPNGVVSWSMRTPGIVESSTNLGTVRTERDRFQLMATITAGVSTRKHAIADQIKTLAQLTGGNAEVYGLDAPEFPYDPDSELLRRAREAYVATRGQEPEVHVSNCSLELGMFTHRLPGLDTISVGTNLSGLHSPAERVSHRSIARVWPFVKALMGRLAA